MYSDKLFVKSDFEHDFIEDEQYMEAEGEDSFLYALYSAFGGSVENMSVLGIIYSSCGHGVKVDYDKAIFWYQRAVDGGDMPSAWRLADIFYRRAGAPKDFKRAFALYKLASDNGFFVATAQLGLMYLNGDGTKKDLVKARELLKVAADAGDRDACFAYSHILKEEGAEGWREYLKMAANQSLGKATWEYYNLLVSEGCADIGMLKKYLVITYYDETGLPEEIRLRAKALLDGLK